MEFYQLEAFVAVVEQQSFTQAADRVCRTEAAVSLAIKKLEHDLGVPLLERGSHKCVVNDAGKVMLGYAREIIELRRKSERAIARFSSLAAGRVTIAAHESVAQYLLPAPLLAFRKKLPDVRIEVLLCSVDEIGQLVYGHLADFGLGISQPNLRGLHSEVLLSDPLILIAAPGHRLARKGTVCIADLRGESFFAHHLPTATTAAIERLFESHGSKFNVAAELCSFEAIKRFVMEGGGIAIIPHSTVHDELRAGTLVSIPVAELQITRRIEIVCRDHARLLPVQEELLALLRTWCWGEEPADPMTIHLPVNDIRLVKSQTKAAFAPARRRTPHYTPRTRRLSRQV